MSRFKSPKDWERVPLQDVAEVRTGVAKGKTGLKVPVDLPYLRVANVQDGHISLTEVKRITVERGQVERYSLRAGDILMTEGATSTSWGAAMFGRDKSTHAFTKTTCLRCAQK